MSIRIYFSLILISGILFLILFSFLAFHNRLAADDYFYLGCVPKHGIWNCMMDLYQNYSARWSAYLLTGFIISVHHSHLTLFLFNIFTIIILITLIYFIFKGILEKSFKMILPSRLVWTYTLLMISTLFFTSFNKGETWFWLVQVNTYLWSIIMALLFVLTLLQSRLNLTSIILIVISTAYIGGASESYSLIFIFLTIVVFLLMKSGNLKKLFPITKTTSIKIFLGLSVLLVSFIITLSAQGNEIRLKALPSPPFEERLIVPFKSLIKLLIYKTLPVLPFLLFFSLPWLILGNHINLPNKKIIRKQYIFYFMIFIFICLLPTSVIMSELGPDRALSVISFSLAFFMAALFFNLGYNHVFRDKYLKLIKIFTAPIILLSVGYNFFLATETAPKYSGAYDKRIVYLESLRDREIHHPVTVAPLPPSGFLYSAEITTDPDHFRNHFLAYAYNLPFKLTLEREIKTIP